MFHVRENDINPNGAILREKETEHIQLMKTMKYLSLISKKILMANKKNYLNKNEERVKNYLKLVFI